MPSPANIFFICFSFMPASFGMMGEPARPTPGGGRCDYPIKPLDGLSKEKKN